MGRREVHLPTGNWTPSGHGFMGRFAGLTSVTDRETDAIWSVTINRINVRIVQAMRSKGKN